MTRIVIAGLGPGDAVWCSEATRRAIERIPHRYLRTAVHPAAELVIGSGGEAETFDHLYESADSFDEVYRLIHQRLVEAAGHHGEILYLVPGSPLVLEHSVRLLLDDPTIDCEVIASMSFLDLAWARLGIDPIDSGVRLVDGHRFAVEAAGERGPLLVAHAHADWVLSEIKLSIDDPGEGEGPEVIVLQRLGTADESMTSVAWSDLDRVIGADHLTTLYIPHLAVPVGAEYVRFHRLARHLRENCPWDIEQTHRSLVPHLIEESYEVIDAIDQLDDDDPSTDEHLIEELGDLLYQIEFHATIAEQQGRFTIADVARTIHDKLVRRHPHVFAPETTGDLDADAVVANWEVIKAAEYGDQRQSVLDGVARSLPALSWARKLQARATRIGFDWPTVDGPLAKIDEELAELRQAIVDDRSTGPHGIEDEIGDLLFATVNVARHLDIEPEHALRRAVERFATRFREVERRAAAAGLDRPTSAELDALWEAVKSGPVGGPDADDGPSGATGTVET